MNKHMLAVAIAVAFLMVMSLSAIDTDAEPTIPNLASEEANQNQTETASAVTVTDPDGAQQYYDTIEDAWNAATTDSTIVIGQSFTEVTQLVLDDSRKLTLNLNGFDLTFADNTDEVYENSNSIFVKHGTLNIEGQGKIASNHKTINIEGSDHNASDFSVLNIGESVVVVGSIAISVDGNTANKGIVVSIHGEIESTGQYGIYIDGNSLYSMASRAIKFTLSSTSSISCPSGTAVYSGGFSIFDIYGNVEGSTGIEFRLGTINIQEGATVSGGNEFEPPTLKTEETDGTSVESVSNGGVGILLSQSVMKRNLSLNIYGGSISGEYAVYEEYLPEINKWNTIMNITDGTFVGKIYSENKSAFISGGHFDQTVDSKYVNAEYTIIESTTGSGYDVVKRTDHLFKVGDTYTSTLGSAIDIASSTDETIIVQESAEIDHLDLANTDFTLDLNSKTLTMTSSEKIGFDLNGCDVIIMNGTIVDNRDTGSGAYTSISVSNGELTLQNVDMQIANGKGRNSATANAAIMVTDLGTVNLTGETSIKATKVEGNTSSLGVFISGISDNQAKTTLNIKDSASIDVGLFAVSGNGNGSNDGTVINLSGNSSITAYDGWGIYQPQIGDISISDNAKISGLTGIEFRSGTLDMTGGSVTSTATELAKSDNPGGAPSIEGGAAIAVSQHSTNNDIQISISGGSLTGPYTLYEEDMIDSNTDGIAMKVTGGAFYGVVSSENVDGFVIGGSFTTDVGKYCAPGCTLTGSDGEFSVSKNDVTYDLKVDGSPEQGQNVTATFSISGVLADGAVFKWTFNGTEISGATGPTYTFTAERSGTLEVEVTLNIYGDIQTISDSAKITVTVTPVDPVDPDEGETTVVVDEDGNTITTTKKNDGSVTVTTEKPADTVDGNKVTEITVKSTDSNGSITTQSQVKIETDDATVSDKAVSAAVEHLQSSAAADEKVVTITTSGGQITLPSNISKVTDAGATIEVVSEIGTIRINDTVADKLTSDELDVTITQMVASVTEMNVQQQQAVGDNTVIELTAANEQRSFHQLGDDVTVFVRGYDLPAGVDADSVLVFYVDDYGRLEAKTTHYDAETKLLSFVTDHFSYYVIGNTSMIAQDQPDDKPVNPGWNPDHDDVWVPPTVVMDESDSQDGMTEIVACAAAAVVAALMAAFLIIERRKG